MNLAGDYPKIISSPGLQTEGSFHEKAVNSNDAAVFRKQIWNRSPPPPPPPLLSIRLEVNMIIYKLDKKSRSVPLSLGVNHLLWHHG